MASEAIYVEYLTIGNWLRIIVPALRRLAQENPSRKLCCYIFDGTPVALCLARAWGRWKGGICVEHLDFKIMDVHDKDGVFVFWRVAYQDMCEIQELIFKNTDFKAFIQNLDPASYAALYVSKTPVCFYDFYGPQKYTDLWHVPMMTQVASWHQRRSNGSTSFSLYINPRAWMNELKEYVQSYGGNLCSLDVLKLWSWRLEPYKIKLRKLNTRLLKIILRHKIFSFKNKYGLAQKKPYFTTGFIRMVTEYYGQLNLGKPQCHSDVFFADGKGIRLEDILLAFNLAIDPIDEEKYSLLRTHDLAAVALTPQSCAVDPALIDVFRPQPETFSEILAPPSKDNGEGIKTLKASLSQYSHLRSYWRQFFERYNIKLYTTWINCEPSQMAIADAVRDNGGISTIYQRSYESLRCPQNTVGSDVIFSFSPARHATMIDNGSRFRHHVAVGYLGDYRFNAVRPKAAEIRQQLASQGAKNIIAYFDENTVDDDRWFIGHAETQKNYSFWLEKLLNEPQLGVIFKPKRPINLRQRLGEVGKLLDRAEKTGRCFVFEGGRLQGVYSPSVAALAADIAIHDSLSSGTAGLESALAGTKTLLMDLEGWPMGPLNKLGGKVVFRDWESTWEACRKYFNEPGSMPRLGDWSAMVHELDPFRDGRAAERMSAYLKELLEGLRRGHKPKDIMDRTADNYARRWGHDKVHRGQDK